MALSETQTKVDIPKQDAAVREFSTRWQDEEARTWHSWDAQDDLMGMVVAGGRGMPVVPLFDYFTGRSEGLIGTVKLYENEKIRVHVDNPATEAPYFVRFADYDAIYVQFSGHSTIETEYGPLELEPFHAGLIPAGVAHRSIGDDECRRVIIYSKVKVDSVALREDGHLTERRFRVTSKGGVRAEFPPQDLDSEWDREVTFLWDEPSSQPLWYKRRRGALSGGTTGGRPPEVIRIFDFFKGMTGKGNGGPGPLLFNNSELYVDVYNTEGQQFGFHRGNGQDELWLQMRSTSINDTEYGEIPLSAGQASIVPPGISHRITGAEGFLRMVLYSHLPLKLCVDPLQRITHTEFTVEEE